MMVQHYKVQNVLHSNQQQNNNNEKQEVTYTYDPEVYFSHALQNKIYSTKLNELTVEKQPTLTEITSESLLKTKQIEENRLTICTSAYNPSEKMMNEIKSLNPSQIVHNYGCGKMMLNVILKEIDMYYLNRPCTKKWDISAGCALIESIGGMAITMDGKPYEFTDIKELVVNSRGLLVVWNKNLYEQLKEQIDKFPVSE